MRAAEGESIILFCDLFQESRAFETAQEEICDLYGAEVSLEFVLKFGWSNGVGWMYGSEDFR